MAKRSDIQKIFSTMTDAERQHRRDLKSMTHLAYDDSTWVTCSLEQLTTMALRDMVRKINRISHMVDTVCDTQESKDTVNDFDHIVRVLKTELDQKTGLTELKQYWGKRA